MEAEASRHLRPAAQAARLQPLIPPIPCHPCGTRRGYVSHCADNHPPFLCQENTFMTNGNGSPPEAAPPPQLNVLAQYTKDLSFENPNAPASLAPQQQQPAINIQINVAA